MTNYYYSKQHSNIEDFIGQVFVSIVAGEEEIKFIRQDGSCLSMYHEQDCCEDARVEDVCGDWEDLLNSPIVVAEAPSIEDFPAPDGYEADFDSYTWTFYKLDTVKGGVTIRWLEYSNGCCSEEVSIATSIDDEDYL